MSETVHEPDGLFGDLTDNRQPGDWETRYTDPKAVSAIRFESFFLWVHLYGGPLILLFCCCCPLLSRALGASYAELLPYICAWFGGMFGGTIFAIKWHYRSVARNIWNRDRRLWRIFTPHVSAALATAFVVICSSGILGIFNTERLADKRVVIAVAFLVGYFSDTAIGKMAEVADTLFGPSRGTVRRLPSTNPSTPPKSIDRPNGSDHP